MTKERGRGVNALDATEHLDWFTPLGAAIDGLLHRRVAFAVDEDSLSWAMIYRLLNERHITPRWHHYDQKRHIFNVDAGIANLAWRILAKAGAKMLIEEPRNPR